MFQTATCVLNTFWRWAFCKTQRFCLCMRSFWISLLFGVVLGSQISQQDEQPSLVQNVDLSDDKLDRSIFNWYQERLDVQILVKSPNNRNTWKYSELVFNIDGTSPRESLSVHNNFSYLFEFRRPLMKTWNIASRIVDCAQQLLEFVWISETFDEELEMYNIAPTVISTPVVGNYGNRHMRFEHLLALSIL